jgi:hypothetical protein
MDGRALFHSAERTYLPAKDKPVWSRHSSLRKAGRRSGPLVREAQDVKTANR